MSNRNPCRFGLLTRQLVSLVRCNTLMSTFESLLNEFELSPIARAQHRHGSSQTVRVQRSEINEMKAGHTNNCRTHIDVRAVSSVNDSGIVPFKWFACNALLDCSEQLIKTFPTTHNPTSLSKSPICGDIDPSKAFSGKYLKRCGVRRRTREQS